VAFEKVASSRSSIFVLVANFAKANPENVGRRCSWGKKLSAFFLCEMFFIFLHNHFALN